MDLILVAGLGLAAVLSLDLVRRRAQRAVTASASTRPNPTDARGKIYEFGSSKLTAGIPYVSGLMTVASALGLGVAVTFSLYGFESLETFRPKAEKTSLAFMVVLVGWHWLRVRANQRVMGQEIITSAEGVYFALSTQLRFLPWLRMLLKGQSYLVLPWTQISEWRVVRTHYDTAGGPSVWTREYRILSNSTLHILSREHMAGIENAFLEDVHSHIGSKLLLEDELVDVSSPS